MAMLDAAALGVGAVRECATRLPRVVWALAVGCTFLMGCQYDPYALRYATASPAKSDIVGTWTGEFNWQGKQERLDKAYPGPFRIELADDGSFVGTNARSTMKGLSSGKGTWRLWRCYEGWWYVELSYLELDGRPSGDGDLLHILDNKPPHKLYSIWDDPDSGNGIIFRRKEDGEPE
jgi:hypothetical protein